MKYRPNKHSKSSDFRCTHRMIQEYGIKEAIRIGALDSKEKENTHNKKKQKKHKKKNSQIKKSKKGIHIGLEHHIKYKAFIQDGGDPNDCPFD